MSELFAKIKNLLIKNKHMLLPVLIVVLLPNFLGFMFGAEYMNYPFKNADTVIVNHDDSATAVSLVKMIKESETFNVVKESTENNDVEEYIRSGKAIAGIIIPEDFSYNINHGKEAKILVFDDGAMSSAGSSIRTKISETLGTIKAGYLIKIAEGSFGMSPQNAKYVASPMGYKTRILGNPTSDLGNMLIEGVLLTIFQMLCMGLPGFIKESKSLKKIFAKTLCCAFIGFLSASLCVFVQHKVFKMPYNGSVLTGGVILALMALSFSFFGMLFRLRAAHGADTVTSKVLAINITMLLAGYTYPICSMPKIFSKLWFWIPNTHIILPMRSIGILGVGWKYIKTDIIWLTVFTLIMIVLLCLKFYLQPIALKKLREREPRKKAGEAV